MSAPVANVLILNAGSSSLKIGGFSTSAGLSRLWTATITDLGNEHAHLKLVGTPAIALEGDRLQAIARALSLLPSLEAVEAIGHRIVHPGLRLHDHQIMTPSVVDELKQAVALDPTHLPAAIEVFTQTSRLLPNARHVACLDTVFHQQMPRAAQLLGIPRKWLDRGVRRLGFHGLSYTYLLGELQRLDGLPQASGRVVLMHLGSGASMAAVRDGHCQDTTMGFTAAAGLVMATRPGDLDPGVVTYIAQQDRLDAHQLAQVLSSSCGLKGVSGRSSDMQELLKADAGDVPAHEAVQLFVHQARRWLGALIITLGGIDTVVITGGIGEHAPEIRSAILADLEFLGLILDSAANAAGKAIISSPASRVLVRVMATDEEHVMAGIVMGLVMPPHSQQGPL